MNKKYYTVQWFSTPLNRWMDYSAALYVSFGYANGYFVAQDSHYPCPVLRIIDSEGKVVRESKGRGEVHVN